MNRCLTLGVLLVCIHCVFAQFPQYPGNVHEPRKEKVPEVDQKCLNCICEASSNCDTTIKCHNSAGGGYYCGPFQVSWAYWHDAGRPGDKGRAHDFEACLNNVTCAGETVRGYMRKYGRDCDKSRTIDCYDFARIHKLGYGACSDDSFYKTDFYEKFDVCYAAGYDDSPNNNDARYNNNDARYNNNDARYNNDGVYNNGGGYNNEGGYSNDGGANNDGSYNNDANVNSGGIGGFVDYGDDHIQARNARMGNA